MPAFSTLPVQDSQTSLAWQYRAMKTLPTAFPKSRGECITVSRQGLIVFPRFLNLRNLKSSQVRDAEDSRKKTLWEQTQARLQDDQSNADDTKTYYCENSTEILEEPFYFRRFYLGLLPTKYTHKLYPYTLTAVLYLF